MIFAVNVQNFAPFADIHRLLSYGQRLPLQRHRRGVPKGFEEPVRLYECVYHSEGAADD